MYNHEKLMLLLKHINTNHAVDS